MGLIGVDHALVVLCIFVSGFKSDLVVLDRSLDFRAVKGPLDFSLGAFDGEHIMAKADRDALLDVQFVNDFVAHGLVAVTNESASDLFFFGLDVGHKAFICGEDDDAKVFGR